VKRQTLIQQMYVKAMTVEVRAVFNSKIAKVTVRKIVKKSKAEKVKIVFTQRFFSEKLSMPIFFEDDL